ncbi:MAG: hypothetical protein MK041_02975 [Aquabacterium sp.]|nr:hypothetical protein [Aquabacterium sp.]
MPKVFPSMGWLGFIAIPWQKRKSENRWVEMTAIRMEQFTLLLDKRAQQLNCMFGTKAECLEGALAIDVKGARPERLDRD